MKKFLFGTLLTALMLGVLVYPADAEVDDHVTAIQADSQAGYVFRLVDGAAPIEGDGITHIAGEVYAADTIDAIYACVSESDLVYIEADEVIPLDPEADEPADTVSALGTGAQWNYSMINASAARAAGITGDGVTVAVIDSGLNPNHPDLDYSKVLQGKNYVDGSTDTTDRINHGTPVSGIIVAQLNDIGIDGIAPDAYLVPLKVFDSSTAMLSHTIEAIYDAVDVYNCDVINMSFGHSAKTEHRAYTEAIQYAIDKGVIIVASAGNLKSGSAEETDANTLHYPAAYSQVVGVGSVSSHGLVSSTSMKNESVYVTAPGVYVTSLSVSGGTSTVSGTSIAAPHVTAMAVLAKSVDASIDSTRFMELLRQSATDAGDPGYNTSYGYGIVDIESFTELLTGGTWFYDLDGHWARAEIMDMVDRGLLTGTDTHVFSPEETMTRGMFVTVVGRYYEQLYGALPDGSANFTDVSAGKYYAKYVAWAADNQIVNGYGDGRFGPEDEITQEQAAIMVRRFSDVLGMDLSVYSLAGGGSIDASSWAMDDVNWAVANGLIGRSSDGEALVPKAPASRAQCCVMIGRCIALGDDA